MKDGEQGRGMAQINRVGAHSSVLAAHGLLSTAGPFSNLLLIRLRHHPNNGKENF